jgi:hypothetical protein
VGRRRQAVEGASIAPPAPALANHAEDHQQGDASHDDRCRASLHLFARFLCSLLELIGFG